jgi:hypothetical protein
LADFADCAPDAVIRVEENIIAPDPGHDFVATDDLAPVLQEQNKDFQRDTFQLEDVTAAAQPSGTKIKREVFAEPDRLLHSTRL